MADSSKREEVLKRLGFSFERGGAHTARTMMLEDLSSLFASVDCPNAGPDDYLSAIGEENCLGKRSVRTRVLTHRHLTDLYGLDRSLALFRVLCHLWERDEAGRPLLALLCAYARDAVLRSSAPFILKRAYGATVTRVAVEEFIDAIKPGRFSAATLKSTAQNVNGTWTRSGHLEGKAKKVRSRAAATPGSAVYALFLGFLSGGRGYSLFETEYAKLLDCSVHRTIELAEDASRKGWIVTKRIGEVIEVQFPGLLSDEEEGWVREQV